MYRRYEDPQKLKRMIARVEEDLDCTDPDEDEERFIDLLNDLEELKERLNFAWQDQEYDENYELYGG